jgi:hypothetical protein
MKLWVTPLAQRFLCTKTTPTYRVTYALFYQPTRNYDEFLVLTNSSQSKRALGKVEEVG